jgi:hypothetical protein
MAKILQFLFIILVVSINGYSQEAIVQTDFNKLKGEEILFLPISDPKLDIKFDCFFSDSLCTKPLSQFNFQIRQKIENNAFTVLNIFSSDGSIIIKLQSSKIGTLYLKKASEISKDESSLSFYFSDYTGFLSKDSRVVSAPILSVKILETFKKRIGEIFAAKVNLTHEDFNTTFMSDVKFNSRGMTDLRSGEMLTISRFEVFKCVDLQLLSTNSVFKQPYLIFENQSGNRVKVAFVDYVGDNPIFEKRLSLSHFYTNTEYEPILKQRNEMYRIIEKEKIEKEEQIERGRIENERIEREKKKEQERLRIERKRECIKLFGETNGTIIAEGKVRIGMTKKMCIYAWGEPEDINKTITKYSVHEQWVYGSGSYLYFEKGILVTIQN